MEELDPINLNYLAIYHATAIETIKILRGGIGASVAKKIVDELGMSAALIYDALNISISTVNRKAKIGAALRIDEAERLIGLVKLVGQVECMVQGIDGADGFNARAWTCRWLGEPVPALGGAAPLEYMSTIVAAAHAGISDNIT